MGGLAPPPHRDPEHRVEDTAMRPLEALGHHPPRILPQPLDIGAVFKESAHRLARRARGGAPIVVPVAVKDADHDVTLVEAAHKVGVLVLLRAVPRPAAMCVLIDFDRRCPSISRAPADLGGHPRVRERARLRRGSRCRVWWRLRCNGGGRRGRHGRWRRGWRGHALRNGRRLRRQTHHIVKHPVTIHLLPA